MTRQKIIQKLSDLEETGLENLSLSSSTKTFDESLLDAAQINQQVVLLIRPVGIQSSTLKHFLTLTPESTTSLKCLNIL